MTTNFILKGKKETSQVYIRLKDTTYNVDAMTGTGITVYNNQFKKGKIQPIKSKPTDLAETKKSISEANKEIEKQNKKLKDIENKLITAYNNRNASDIINAKWIKNVLTDKAKDKTPNEVIPYFDYYYKAKSNKLGKETLKKIKNVRNRFSDYESDRNISLYFSDLDKNFREDFEKWCIEDNDYHFNTFQKQIKVLMTICRYAKETDKKEITDETLSLNRGKEMKPIKTKFVTLSFEELKEIEYKEIKIKELDITRDWLLICCYTAQRVGDFLNYTKDNLITLDDDNLYLDIVQAKTKQQVYIPLNNTIKRILKKYNNNFPPLYSKSKSYNEKKYNELVKRVGSYCGINEIVTANLKIKNRLETITDKKYKFLQSHTGRRSFATNYNGKIETRLIMAITGHRSEIVYNSYLQHKPTYLAKEFAIQSSKLDN